MSVSKKPLKLTPVTQSELYTMLLKLNHNLFSVIIALLLMSVPFSEAGAQKSPTKKQLTSENRKLSERLDSLSSELERVQAMYDELYASTQVEENAEDGAFDFRHYTPQHADSIMSLWTIQQLLAQDDSVSVPDPETFISNVTDEQYMERLSAMNSFFPLPYNDVVRSYIIRYSEKYPKMMSGILSLCYYYMPIFEEALARYGLPQELKVLAIVESALNPKARSRAGALGPWQFMYAAAKGYGLRMNSFFDERMDPYKSVDAAARYLRDSYKLFGDWSLAISSYNCGPGGVRKAIARSGGKTAYWDIYPYLPRETRNYVPAFVGMLYALYYRKELGLEPAPFSMPAQVDTFHIRHRMHFKQIEDMVGIPVEEIRRINPMYMYDVIPGDSAECELRLPYNYTESFAAVEDSVYKHKASEYLSDAVIKNITSGAAGLGNYTTYKVKSGDTLGGIAHRYHTTVSNLKRWNGLKSDRLRIGQIIKIQK